MKIQEKNSLVFSLRPFPFAVVALLGLLICTPVVGTSIVQADANLSPIEELGKRVFFDNISIPRRMSCSTCHDPSAGWTFRNAGVNLHQVAVPGADPHTAGSVKPPTNAYATLIPPFAECPTVFPAFLCGGNFWDGRAEGNEFPLFFATEHIGEEIFSDYQGTPNPVLKAAYERYLGPVADQALQPFPNPVEQNIEREGVCRHVASARYAELFEFAWGEPIDCSPVWVDQSYKRIAVALAAWQGSHEVNSFSSKRDIALQRELSGLDVDDTPGEFPLVGLTDQENYGHDLFYATFFSPIVVDGVTKFSNCAICHSDAPGDTGAEPFQLYSDHGYHNIGIPANPEIPDAGTGIDPDEGLAGRTDDLSHLGLFKTPTMRNVDKRPGKGFIKAYGHNGWFKSLESIVHFYNTADVDFPANGKTRCADGVTTEREALEQNCWPAPAHQNGSAIGFVLGRLGLTPEDEAALVAYLGTLTDTYTPREPKPYKVKR
jgi:cytochrome c peroxidase